MSPPPLPWWSSSPLARAGTSPHNVIVVRQNTVQLMTARIVHVSNLMTPPGSGVTALPLAAAFSAAHSLLKLFTLISRMFFGTPGGRAGTFHRVILQSKHQVKTPI
jgi:hypothetical protein